METTATERRSGDRPMWERLAASAAAAGARVTDEEVRAWLSDVRDRTPVQVKEVPLDTLDGWSVDPDTGAIGHPSGGFFTIEAMEKHATVHGSISHTNYPIIIQPDMGTLGILLKEFDGVPHLLMQAVVEPGNPDGVLLGPTVQDTWSTRAENVPYLEYFTEPDAHRIVADVRQSEQGSWFFRKRNRNVVVETDDDVEAGDGHRWLSLGQVLGLFAEGRLNVSACSVLSCLPFTGPGRAERAGDGDAFRAALLRSCEPDAPALHGTTEVVSWLNRARTYGDMNVERINLADADMWKLADGVLAHGHFKFFWVSGNEVTVGDDSWTQPMIRTVADALVVFLVRNIDGVLHVLVNSVFEGGYVDVSEFGPSLQCIPAFYEQMTPDAYPRFLEELKNAEPSRIRYETTLIDHGDVFQGASGRYVILETDVDVEGSGDGYGDFRWVTIGQLAELNRHSHYLNQQARNLLLCLQAMCSADAG
ncbi:NDP-hexose 2,3-dehydratase family protein [Actinomadura sp. WMMB 499]|uniref:NDP-hexose 2,3-dehydratase family protein n=1 Tax=Actinomadura sp. WMMB 499 TaxID=1219491 RepID=UPI001243A4CA|nr:NDP-hexose 2,3-dehydratase family protein [Actinomadura sp. WMMB 499]QFG24774.1 NDP-hexose 2,3-dehydratase [Actinomadura sp. WMMB 499]